MLGFAPIAASPLGAPSANETFSISAQNGVYALSLQGAGKLITDIYPSGSFLLNGRAVALNKGKAISAESGTYTLSGSTADIETRSNDANILLDRNYGLVAANGSYTVTLQDATLKQGFGLIAESGAYTLSGQDFTLQIAVSISADSGAFVLTGQDASRNIGEVFDSGSFTVTVTDADLVYGRSVELGFYSYAASGQAVIFRGFLSPFVPLSIYTEQTDAASNPFTEATDGSTPIWTEVA